MGDHWDEPRCRVCGNRVQVRFVDDVAAPHRSRVAEFERLPGGGFRRDFRGRRVRGWCSGSGRPIAGEPPCTPECRTVGSWGVPLVEGKAHAATHVCGDQGHQREAAEWVKGITGEWGAMTLFPAREVKVWQPPGE